VRISVCVCVYACVHPSLCNPPPPPPPLQSSTRRSAKVSLSTADTGGIKTNDFEPQLVLKHVGYVFQRFVAASDFASRIKGPASNVLTFLCL